MVRQWFAIGLVCLAGLVVSGCGRKMPRLTPVQGKVTYKGQPLAGATVRFIPAQGEYARGSTDAGGRFALSTGARSGAPVGQYRVSVSKYAPQAAARKAKYEDVKKAKRYQGGKMAVPPKSEIPERYGSPEQSGLAAEVTGNPAKDDFEFNLVE